MGRARGIRAAGRARYVMLPRYSPHPNPRFLAASLASQKAWCLLIHAKASLSLSLFWRALSTRPQLTRDVDRLRKAQSNAAAEQVRLDEVGRCRLTLSLPCQTHVGPDGTKPQNCNMMNCFQVSLSISTCAATTRPSTSPPGRLRRKFRKTAQTPRIDGRPESWRMSGAASMRQGGAG